MSLRHTFIVGVMCGALTASVTYAEDSAQTPYQDALAKEQALRANPNPPVNEWESVIRAYEAVVRRYPASAYSDNALWQAAGLARDLSAHTGDVRDQYRASRLLRTLVSEYPSSKLVPAAVVEITRLAGADLVALPARRQPAETTSTPVPPHSVSEPSASALRRAAPVVIRAINRVVLPEVVRIVVELDGEVPFHHERIDHPTRVLVDLQGTQITPALRDAVLSYDDDIVRHVRIGRHPASTTRIVLDVDNLARYSFFVLYEPVRLVIDCERVATGAIAASRPAELTPRAEVLPSTPRILPASLEPAPIVARAHVLEPAGDAPPPVQDHDEPEQAIEANRIPPALLAPPTPPAANVQGGFSLARQLGLGASRIVIDPGHGGYDPGALNDGLSEAEVVLDIALRLETLLLERPKFAVVLTRRTDAYVSLEERTGLANREGADLFLSIHANASGNSRTRGVETYVLNFAATADAAAVAARENSASGRTMKSLPDIVKSITLSNKREESRDFAALVQRALFRQLRTAGMRDLGVKQAPFVVLIGAEMPSILAEVAFLTNRQDQQLLKNVSYRQRIAEALLNGILRYQQMLKTTSGKLAQQ